MNTNSPEGRALGTAGEVAPFSASPAAQNTGPAALKQPTTCAAAMAMLQKEQGCAGATGGFDAPESIASTN